MSQINCFPKPNNRKEYSPNLEQLLSQCELNYLLCLRLWPSLFEINGRPSSSEQQGEVLGAENEAVKLSAKIIDLARYTTTMSVTVNGPTKTFKKPINLIVRLYHDAKMLEVMEGTGPGVLKAVYINDEQKKQADEKQQINRFVGECLRACLK